MAFFEQAAVLATSWANHPDLRALGAKAQFVHHPGEEAV